MERADRKYLGWTLALFALLGLVGLGTVLYRPLRLRYAIYQLETIDPDDVRNGQIGIAAYEPSLRTCAQAACTGNRRAAAAIIRASQYGSWRFNPPLSGMIFDLAAAQPEMFFGLLGKEPEDEIVELLRALELRCAETTREASRGDFVMIRTDVGRSIGDAAVFIARHFKEDQQSNVPSVRRVATAGLDFTRHQFAKELAEAEKATPKVPKP